MSQDSIVGQILYNWELELENGSKFLKCLINFTHEKLKGSGPSNYHHEHHSQAWIWTKVSAFCICNTDKVFYLHCVTRASPLFFRSWVALSFKVCRYVSQYVRDRWHLTSSPIFPQYIVYQLVPPITDSVPPNTDHCCTILIQYTAFSPRNAHLSQLDLVRSNFSFCTFRETTKKIDIS